MIFSQLVKSTLAATLEVLAPNHCCLCGAFDYTGRDPWLCDPCRDNLPILESTVCIRCGYPELMSGECRECSPQGPFANLVHRSMAPHQGAIRTLIHQFKYQSCRPLAATMINLVARQARLVDFVQECELLVPIPISASRLRWRGFNQAELLATELAAVLDRPVLNCLTRQHRAVSQIHLDRQSRLANQVGSMACTAAIPSHVTKILLIDDVCTTGATLTAAALAIKTKHTHLQISAFSFARTLTQTELQLR